MSEQPAYEITQDDKLIAALGYIFTPLVPIIILLMEDKKERPFIKAHNMQALVLGIVLVVYYSISSVLTALLIGCAMLILGLVAQFYWAYKAFQGELVHIPVISDFVKNQGWG